MTGLPTILTALVAAAGVALSGAVGSDGPSGSTAGTALVIDAGAAREGRELVDPRLLDVGAEVRLPRDVREARTNVRYFSELGYGLVVAGSRSRAAADAAGIDATHAASLSQALNELQR